MSTSSRGTATINGATVTVNSINLPTGAGQSMTVTVTGVAGVANLCSSGQSGNWTAQPWTGSSVGNGQKFNPKPSSTYPVPTSIPATCYTLTYLAGPNGSITGTSPQTVAIGGNGTAVTAVPAATLSVRELERWLDHESAHRYQRARQHQCHGEFRAEQADGDGSCERLHQHGVHRRRRI